MMSFLEGRVSFCILGPEMGMSGYSIVRPPLMFAEKIYTCAVRTVQVDIKDGKAGHLGFGIGAAFLHGICCGPIKARDRLQSPIEAY